MLDARIFTCGIIYNSKNSLLLNIIHILNFYFIYHFGCSGSLLLFSTCGEWGLLSSCSVWAPHCSGFSYRRAEALGCARFGSRGLMPLERRLRSCGPQGSVASRRVGSSQISDRTCASNVGRQILYP